MMDGKGFPIGKNGMMDGNPRATLEKSGMMDGKSGRKEKGGYMEAGKGIMKIMDMMKGRAWRQL